MHGAMPVQYAHPRSESPCRSCIAWVQRASHLVHPIDTFGGPFSMKLNSDVTCRQPRSNSIETTAGGCPVNATSDLAKGLATDEGQSSLWSQAARHGSIGTEGRRRKSSVRGNAPLVVLKMALQTSCDAPTAKPTAWVSFHTHGFSLRAGRCASSPARLCYHQHARGSHSVLGQHGSSSLSSPFPPSPGTRGMATLTSPKAQLASSHTAWAQRGSASPPSTASACAN